MIAQRAEICKGNFSARLCIFHSLLIALHGKLYIDTGIQYLDFLSAQYDIRPAAV